MICPANCVDAAAIPTAENGSMLICMSRCLGAKRYLDMGKRWLDVALEATALLGRQGCARRQKEG